MNTEYLVDGVRVLCEHQAEKPWSVWFYIAVFVIVIFMVVFISGILNMSDEVLLVSIISLVPSFLLGIPLGLIMHESDVENALPLRYDVTIDGDVNFVEFDRRFYVIEQNGEIYTIAYRSDMK